MRLHVVLLATAMLTVGSITADEFRPIGSFHNVQSSHNGRILGLFDHHEGLCGDPPCEVLQDVSYDRRTGHLSFAALNEKFTGTLRRDDVVGTIDGKRVRLARANDDRMDAKWDKSLVEWCAFWRTVHRCRGVDQVCSAKGQ
jgi:hypothetical protein